MLGKLLKYDMRYMSKLLILLHIPVIFLAIAAKYAGVVRLYALNKAEPLALLTLAAAVIYLSFTSFFTQLYSAVYSYRKLFSREGYLTLTLPVKTSAQVLSKFLSGSIWSLINIVVLSAAVAYVLCTTPLSREIAQGVTDAFGAEFANGYSSFLWLLFLLSVLSCFSNMAMILGCIAFGHCFRKHRVLTAIAGYAGLTMLMQIVTVFVQTLTVFNNPHFYQDSLTAPEFFSLYMPLLYTSMAFSVLLGVLCYLFSLYVMNKRLNLD